MTIVVALSCKDGVVIASDSQVTFGTSGGPMKGEVEKVFKIGESTLVGFAGSMNMIQKSRKILEQFAPQLDQGMDDKLLDKLLDKLHSMVTVVWDRHRELNHDEDGMPSAEILMAVKDKGGKYHIVHISGDCKSEYIDEIGHTFIGGGDVFGETSLRSFIERHKINESDVGFGSLLAYKVIAETKALDALGVGGPANIWVATQNGVKQLKNENLHQAYLEWVKRDAKVIEELKTDPVIMASLRTELSMPKKKDAANLQRKESKTRSKSA